MAILFLVILVTAKNRSHYSRMHSPLRDVVVHSWKAVTQVLSFSFMTRIIRNRCLLMGFAKWMLFSEQEIEDENETTSESSEAECKDEESECKDGWQDKDKLECEKEWVVFQEESESDISEKEMEREEERNSKKKVKASGPYFICLRLDTALENLGFEKAACFQNSGCN